MFICDETINTDFTVKQHVDSVLKDVQTAFPYFGSDAFTQGKINYLKINSSNYSRIEIIHSIINDIIEVERNGQSSRPFIEVLNILSEKFGYQFEIDATYPNMLTCYKYVNIDNWDTISVPVTKIKYIKQHDHVRENANTRLSRSRVSCVNDAGEEFRIYKHDGVYICFQSDLVYKSAVSFLNQAINAAR